MATCAECRASAASGDPSALFALLVLREPDDEALEEVSRSVAARVAVERRSVLDAWSERGLPRFLPAAIAASAGLAFLLAGLLGPVPPGPHAPEFASADVRRADVRLTETVGPAQVVDLTVGNTQVVMIFAAEIDL
jgi:hypothetical protein